MRERYYKAGAPKKISAEMAAFCYKMDTEKYMRMVDSIHVKDGVLWMDLTLFVDTTKLRPYVC